MKLTSGSKDGVVYEHRPIYDLSFLKRGFRWHYSSVVGPIDLHSIAKSFLWTKGTAYLVPKCESFEDEEGITRYVFPRGFDSETCEPSWAHNFVELALHGREVYEEWRDVLLPQMAQLGVNLTVPFEEAFIQMGIPNNS